MPSTVVLQQCKIRLSEIMAIWDILRVGNTGDINYSDFVHAIEEIVEVENDIETTGVCLSAYV